MNHAAVATNDEILIRRATDGEARACRLMMPEIFGPSHAPELWVAIDRETSLLVGGAGAAWHLVSDPPGFPVYVHVLPSVRRRGIATALVNAVARACSGDACRLNAWFDVAPNSSAATFMAAIGFTLARQVFDYEAGGAEFYARIKAIHDRFARAGKLPADFRIVPLGEAPAEAVAALVADHLSMASATAVARVVRGTSSHDPQRSVVLLKGQAVLGSLLYSWNHADPVIDCWIVAPTARGTAANLMLVEAATRNGLAGGAQRFRFSCTDDVLDTVNLAQRGGARQIATRLRYSRPI